MKFIILFLFNFLPCLLYPQDSLFSAKMIEEKMKSLQKKVFLSIKEEDRFNSNKEFIKLWQEILVNPESMSYPFDSITEVSKLSSKDKSLRLITWNIFKDDGTYSFYGFIQRKSPTTSKRFGVKNSEKQAYKVFQLTDKSNSIKKPEFYIGDNNKWLGMTYVDIIDCDDYYTLLGWGINDKSIKRKYIDILSFKTDGSPIFGKDVFVSSKKDFKKRVIFEYSSEVSMLLKYDKSKKMIIFNFLAPKEYGKDAFEGQHQYYGPDGSYDAFELKKKKWILKEDIDARNEKSVYDNAPKPDLKKQNKLYVPQK
jgi:hypothetical protein